MPLNGLLHLWSARHVSGTYMPIIRSSRLYLWYYHIWCVKPWLLVVGGQEQGSKLCVRDEGNCSSSFRHPCCPAPDSRPPATKALHTICGNITSIVSSSWWWAYKCPKYIEQIISAINQSVESSWFLFYAYTFDLICTEYIFLMLETFKHLITPVVMNERSHT